MKLLARVCAAAALALCCTRALAQSGSLEVRVLDPAGAPLPGAVVTVTNAAQLSARATKLTDRTGIAEFPVLRAGAGYAVEVSFPGYSARALRDIKVQIGDRQLVPVSMAASIREQVDVKAERGVVDLESTATATRFSDQFIQDLPVPGRTYQNILTLSPGVLDADGDGNPNVNGARARDFKALVSGVSNVDPLTGEWLSEVNPETIEEIVVIGAGAGVEYGRAQGGFAQVLQKQGSNDFEGVARYLYGSYKLDGAGATGLPQEKIPAFEWVQPSLQISGPIRKDRFWYRLAYESVERQDPVNAGGQVAVTTRSQSIESYQLTWQASPRNKIALRLDRDPKTLGNVGIDARITPEASRTQEYGGPTYSLTWTAAQSPRLLVDSMVAYQEGRVNVRPSVPGVGGGCLLNVNFPVLDEAPCFFTTQDSLHGSYYITSNDRRQRLTVKTQAELFAGKFLGAAHRLKFGVSIENERYYRTMEKRPDLTFEVDPFGNVGTASYRIPFPAQTSARVTGATWGVYAEDQMRLPGGVTVSAGLRVDGEATDSLGYSPFDPEAQAREFDRRSASGENPAQILATQFTAYQDLQSFSDYLTAVLGVSPSDPVFSGVTIQSGFWRMRRRPEDVRLRNTNPAPRLSVAWDPRGDGKTKLFASAGRYYDKIFLGVPLIELEPATTTFTFTALKVAGRFISVQSQELSTSISTRIVDRGLRTPYQDEWSAGFEREIAPDTALKLTWIDRRFRDQLQDIDLNHAPGDYGSCLPRAPWVLTRNGPDGVLDDCYQGSDGATDLYIQNPGWDEVLLVGNFNRAHYQGAILELVKRFSRSWQLETSYTWSKAIGDAEDFDQYLGNDRTTAENEKGFLAYDQTHVFKLNSTTLLGRGIRLGSTVQFESGLPYSILVSAKLPDAVPPVYLGVGQPETRLRLVYPTGRRNDQRNPSFWTFNLRLEREMAISNRVNLSLSAEAFNVLNDDRLWIHDVTNGTTNSERRFGRRWQVGARLAF